MSNSKEENIAQEYREIYNKELTRLGAHSVTTHTTIELQVETTILLAKLVYMNVPEQHYAEFMDKALALCRAIAQDLKNHLPA